MFLITSAHKLNRVQFDGRPRFIHFSSYLDTTANVILGEGIVISMDVLLLTHDYSLTTALKSIGKQNETDIAFIDEIRIGKNCFIGAKSLVLPGTIIGDNVIIGAGSVVKGTIPSNCIVVGNPAKPISDIQNWARDKSVLLNPNNLFVDKK